MEIRSFVNLQFSSMTYIVSTDQMVYIIDSGDVNEYISVIKNNTLVIF
jgi:hypothetical protein